MTNEQITAIYDSFGKKDMTKAEFHKEVQRLTDPKLMADEADRMAHGEIARKQIDKRLN